MKNLTLIVAREQSHGIGFENTLPWPKLTEDLKHFKETTNGHTVIMGSATLKSIGRTLPNRRNYVLSSQPTLINEYPTISLFQSSACLTTVIKNELLFNSDKQYFIIGGQTVYDQFIDECDKLIVTEIEGDFKCDRFFEFDESLFELKSSVYYPQTDSNPVGFKICEYIRK